MVGRGVQGVVGDVSIGAYGSGGAAVATRDSVLILDADRHAVRALLFDLVDGAPRFVGEGYSFTASAAGAPVPDRLWDAIHLLEQETGRQLTTGRQVVSPQLPNGDGVDEVLLTGLPVHPNKAALISIGSGALGQQLTKASVSRPPSSPPPRRISASVPPSRSIPCIAGFEIWLRRRSFLCMMAARPKTGISW